MVSAAIADEARPFRFEQVSHDDPGPFPGKQPGFGLTHAIGGTRNESDFPLESHTYSFEMESGRWRTG